MVRIPRDVAFLSPASLSCTIPTGQTMTTCDFVTPRGDKFRVNSVNDSFILYGICVLF